MLKLQEWQTYPAPVWFGVLELKRTSASSMRLINTFTLTQEDFPGSHDIPDYAILSHCWGSPKEEVTFRELRNNTYRQDCYGWRKIVECYHLAQDDGLQWAWVDTCCIDKRSSAELAEAISSMFKWYEAAKVCYAFLPDIDTDIHKRPFWSTEMQSFANSRWFTRGWTLQELLAPANVVFFDRSFQKFGTKLSLALPISKVTGIDRSYLERHRNFRSASVAARMSWASRRETSRTEDTAYCLLGLFDVNMPLLYGEGSNAFLRLQSAIIQSSQDSTILAWEDYDRGVQEICGVLAQSPRAFLNSKDIVEDEHHMHPSEGSFEMTSRGLQYWLKSYPYGAGSFLPIRLRCKVATSNKHIMLRTVRIGRSVYRSGLEKRQLGGRERLLTFVLALTIPSHFIYIATTLPRDNASLTTRNISSVTALHWVSRYGILTTILAFLLSAIGIVLWLLGGSKMYLIALGCLHVGLEVAPLTARTVLPLMWAICGLCAAFFSA